MLGRRASARSGRPRGDNGRPSWPRLPNIRGSSASARPGSISTTTTARATFRSGCSAPISRPREASGLPLIVHAREADDEIARILREERPPARCLHCFSSGRGLAEAALELGFYISISGIVTFRNAEDLRAIVRDVPLDRLLVETDAPYLAPVPYRGKRNEPAFVAATAAAVAALKGIRAGAVWQQRRPRISSQLFPKATPRGGEVHDRRMKVTVLGCGASWGVPAIGPDWGRCDPADPRNRRRRCSLLVESRGAVLLIDTAPDLRQQLLDAGVSRLDAVLLTHAHADHLHGIDDLRIVNQLVGQAIPFYAEPRGSGRGRRGASAMPCCRRRTARSTGRRWSARRSTARSPPPACRSCRSRRITATARPSVFASGRSAIRPMSSSSTRPPSRRSPGSRCGSSIACGASRIRRTATWRRRLAWIERVRPRRAMLTHMDQSLDYRELCGRIAAGVEPGYDGLTIEVPEP